MLRIIWRGFACWREWKVEKVVKNQYGYVGCIGMGPICFDLWTSARNG